MIKFLYDHIILTIILLNSNTEHSIILIRLYNPFKFFLFDSFNQLIKIRLEVLSIVVQHKNMAMMYNTCIRTHREICKDQNARGQWPTETKGSCQWQQRSTSFGLFYSFVLLLYKKLFNILVHAAHDTNTHTPITYTHACIHMFSAIDL